MTVYVYREGLGVIPKEEAAPQRGLFHYWPDLPPYLSPLGTGEVTSRTQRAEELKRADCREVDPSERSSLGPYQNQRWMQAKGLRQPKEFG